VWDADAVRDDVGALVVEYRPVGHAARGEAAELMAAYGMSENDSAESGQSNTQELWPSA
jgi:hypothetical protein